MTEDPVTKGGAGEKGADSVVGNVARYASSNIFRHVLRVVNAFLKPMLLAPELLGLWNLLNLIPGYVPYVYLGSSTAMRYQIPANLARGDKETNKGLAGAVFIGTLLLSLIVVAGLLAAASIFPMSIAAKTGLCCMAVLVVLAWYHEYQVSLLKAHQEFRLLSAVNIIYASILSILSVVLILLFRIYGLYAALLISSAATILYIRLRYRFPPRNPAQWSTFCNLVRTGFPITLFSMGAMLMQTSDKLIISSVLGLEQLGHYGIASMAFGFLMHIPGATREVLEPRLMYDQEHQVEETILQNYLAKPLLSTAYLMPLLIGPAVLLLPEFVAALMPVYSSGVPAAQILLVGGFFLALSHILRGLIIAKGLQLVAAKLMFSVAAINCLLSLVLLKIGLGITGVALASGLSFFALFVAQLHILHRRMPAALDHARVLIYLVPFSITVVLLGILGLLQAMLPSYAILSSLVAVMLYSLLLLLVYNRAADRFGYFPRLTLNRLRGNR